MHFIFWFDSFSIQIRKSTSLSSILRLIFIGNRKNISSGIIFNKKKKLKAQKDNW